MPQLNVKIFAGKHTKYCAIDLPDNCNFSELQRRICTILQKHYPNLPADSIELIRDNKLVNDLNTPIVWEGLRITNLLVARIEESIASQYRIEDSIKSETRTNAIAQGLLWMTVGIVVGLLMVAAVGAAATTYITYGILGGLGGFVAGARDAIPGILSDLRHYFTGNGHSQPAHPSFTRMQSTRAHDHGHAADAAVTHDPAAAANRGDGRNDVMMLMQKMLRNHHVMVSRVVVCRGQN